MKHSLKNLEMGLIKVTLAKENKEKIYHASLETSKSLSYEIEDLKLIIDDFQESIATLRDIQETRANSGKISDENCKMKNGKMIWKNGDWHIIYD